MQFLFAPQSRLGLIKLKRLSAVALGVGVALAQSAPADTWVSKCSGCASTTDFSTRARTLAQQIYQSGGNPATIYVLSSDTAAKSAYMSLTGTEINNKNGNSKWQTTAVTPVDQLGNSLAAQSESTLQTIYTAQDTVVIGSDRTNPVLPQGGFNLPAFETSSDAQIAASYAGTFASILSTYANNSTLQITFANGTVASFTVSWAGPTNNAANFHLIYIPNTAKNKKGQAINHNGTPAPTQLHNGNVPDGGGSFNIPGIGTANSGWNWQFDNLPTGTATVGPPIEVQSIVEGNVAAQYDSYY